MLMARVELESTRSHMAWASYIKNFEELKSCLFLDYVHCRTHNMTIALYQRN